MLNVVNIKNFQLGKNTEKKSKKEQKIKNRMLKVKRKNDRDFSQEEKTSRAGEEF